MYPENPEGTQVIVGSMNMKYISDYCQCIKLAHVVISVAVTSACLSLIPTSCLPSGFAINLSIAHTHICTCTILSLSLFCNSATLSAASLLLQRGCCNAAAASKDGCSNLLLLLQQLITLQPLRLNVVFHRAHYCLLET